jgi:regulator of protease activity HflC (stomatin/prohibitin superfamily)
MSKYIIGLVSIFMIAISSLIGLSGCGCVQVKIGEVGVKYKQFGSAKGVEKTPYYTGTYILGFGENMEIMPLINQRYVFTQDIQEESPTDEAIYFQDKNGLSLNADFVIQAHIDGNSAPALYEQYKLHLKDIVKTFGRDALRDVTVFYGSTFTVDSLYGSGRNKFDQLVKEGVTNHFAGTGLIIDNVSPCSKIRIPQNVEQALNLKMEAMQNAERARNQIAEAEANAQKLEAQARGQKAKQELESSTLTPVLLRKMWIDKWDGKLPTVITSENSSNLLNIPTQ